MTTSPPVVSIRPALPFALSDLILRFGTYRELWSCLHQEFDTYTLHWNVQAFARDETGIEGEQVASAELWTFDVVQAGPWGDGQGIADLLDSESGDTNEYASLFVDDDFDPAIGTSAGTSLLVLDRLTVAEPYRGHGVGPLVAALALKELSPGCAVAACYPAPIEGEFDGGEQAEEVARLGRIWSKVGFEHFRDGVWIINLADKTLDGALDKMLGSLR